MDMFEKIFKIAKYVVLAVISILTFILVINERCMLRMHGNGFDAEMLCFAAFGACMLTLSYDINGKIKHLGKIAIVSAIIAAVYTVIVILTYDYFRYLGYNNYLDWVDPVSYESILKSDLTFTGSWLDLKYPCLFVAGFGGCFIAGIFGGGAEKSRREYALSLEKMKFEKYEPGKLRKLYEKTFDKTHQKNFRDYLKKNLYSKEIKQELIELIEEYKSIMLIRFLVGNFQIYLTDEEKEYYENMFVELMGEYLDNSIEKYNEIKEKWPDICGEILENEHDYGLFSGFGE